MNFNAELPLNQTSFGQSALNLLFPWYQKGLEPNIFPIGPIQLNTYSWINSDFQNWLSSCIKKAAGYYSAQNPCFKLWHLNGAQSKVSDKQVLLTFHETDRITPTESNLINNQGRVLVTSDYTKRVFESLGAKNIAKAPLGFDDKSFKVIDKQYWNPNIVCFGLMGKLEKRKRHLDILKLWAKKYGNNRNFFLNCALLNPFLSSEQQSAAISQALEGKRYFNIDFKPYLDNNFAYNDFLNSNHIVFGLSSCEGWDLPVFQSLCLGKHAIVLNAHAYQEYANNDNSVLVEPNGMEDIYDDIFFQKGSEFNQGQSFTWDENAFYQGIDEALSRYQKNPLNENGLKLQKEFTCVKTAEQILEELKNAS